MRDTFKFVAFPIHRDRTPTPSRPPPSRPCLRVPRVPARLPTQKTPQRVLGLALIRRVRCSPGGMRSKAALPGRRASPGRWASPGEAVVWAWRRKRRRRQRWSRSSHFRSCTSQGGLCTSTGEDGEGGREGGVCCGQMLLFAFVGVSTMRFVSDRVGSTRVVSCHGGGRRVYQC